MTWLDLHPIQMLIPATLGLVALAGCLTEGTVGSYVCNIRVDSSGRVVSVERCSLVEHREAKRLEGRSEGCSEAPTEGRVTPPAEGPLQVKCDPQSGQCVAEPDGQG